MENDPLAMGLVAQLLAARLPDLRIVGRLDSGFDTLDHRLAHPQAADLILMDMHLGDIDGPKVTWQLRHAGDATPVLGMTSLPLNRYDQALRIAGAQGLRSKRDIAGIVALLPRIARGGACDGYETAADAVRRIGAQTHSMTILTPTQGRIMDLMDRGYSDDDIAERLGCSPATVRKHRQHALKRLGVGNAREGVSKWRHLNRMFGLD
ncbi:MAG: response regulator transcription factor [Bifidobacterium sp.]|nr:response regulator transcription factor [Bifidobacterium sp.]